MYKITQRQRTLLLLASHGATSRDIARALSVSKAAVDSVRRDILKNMNAMNMTHAVAKAIAHGIITYDPSPDAISKILGPPRLEADVSGETDDDHRALRA